MAFQWWLGIISVAGIISMVGIISVAVQATQMQLKVLFRRKAHGRPDF